MNTHLTPEQTQEILSYADKFFFSEENQSTFTRYFLTLLLGITIICNEGLLALEELCDEVSPPF